MTTPFCIRLAQTLGPVKKPVPICQAFGIFLRNSRRSGAPDPDFGERLGIGEGAASLCLLFGLSISSSITAVIAWLLVRFSTNLSWSLFIVVMAAFFVLAHVSLCYAAYRFWFSRCYPRA